MKLNTNLEKGKLKIEDKVLKKGFAQVPRLVLKAEDLSRNAKCLYALLLDYAWQTDSCFPGQDKLAKDLNVSERTIRRDLTELKEYGLINWEQRGVNKTNVYYLLSLEFLDKSDQQVERTQMSGQDQSNSAEQERTNMTDIIEEGKKTQNNNTQSLSLGKQNEEFKKTSNKKLFLNLEKRKIDYDSFDAEAKFLAEELKDKENIFYYQSVIRRRNKGEITDAQIQSALQSVKDKLRVDQVDGTNFWKKPGAMFTNKLKELVNADIAKNNQIHLTSLVESKKVSEETPNFNSLRNKAISQIHEISKI
jgi:predicted transcriptional regulator